MLRRLHLRPIRLRGGLHVCVWRGQTGFPIDGTIRWTWTKDVELQEKTLLGNKILLSAHFPIIRSITQLTTDKRRGFIGHFMGFVLVHYL